MASQYFLSGAYTTLELALDDVHKQLNAWMKRTKHRVLSHQLIPIEGRMNRAIISILYAT